MFYLYVPFFLIISTILSGSLIIIINLMLNLIWLTSKDFNISAQLFFNSLLSDLSNGIAFFIIVLITFFIAFIVTAIVRYFFPIDRRIAYSLAGFFGIFVMLKLTTLVFTGAALIAGMRSILGLLLLSLCGLFGGYVYGLLLNRNIK